MHQIFKSHHPVRHVNSFKYAFTGIFRTLLNEANFRAQLLISAFAVWLGIHYKITNIEWGILIISLGALLSAEMLNTVVEEFIDHLIKEETPGAKIIKDTSSGFVLVTAITALAVLILLFGHRIL